MAARGETRKRILDAAAQLMRETGLARTTTKQIAHAVGCSEPALYRHFANKEELFVAVLQERLPPFGALVAGFTEDPGGRAVGDCLVEIAVQAVLFYEESTAISAALFAEPALLQRHREAMTAMGTGPHLPLAGLSDLLRAEQQRGRIAPDADPDAAAAALLGACFQRAFLHAFAGAPGSAAPATSPHAEHEQQVREFATSVVTTLLAGIATPAVAAERSADG